MSKQIANLLFIGNNEKFIYINCDI